MPEDEKRIKKILKKEYKDIAPVKDIISEIEEEDPESVEDIKRKLRKK